MTSPLCNSPRSSLARPTRPMHVPWQRSGHSSSFTRAAKAWWYCMLSPPTRPCVPAGVLPAQCWRLSSSLSSTRSRASPPRSSTVQLRQLAWSSCLVRHWCRTPSKRSQAAAAPKSWWSKEATSRLSRRCCTTTSRRPEPRCSTSAAGWAGASPTTSRWS